jgi:hypothetical protein
VTLSDFYGLDTTRKTNISQIRVTEKTINGEMLNFVYAWFHDVIDTQFVMTFHPYLILVVMERQL